MNLELFASFRPDADELLRRISRRTDDHMLNEIAAADYGKDIKQHLSHLLPIRDHSMFVSPMDWHPQEVLELIRWSEPEDPSWKPGGTGTRGHWMRAFACTALLRAAGDLENSDLRNGWNQTLVQLIDSLRSLGTELYEPAIAFLAWLIPHTAKFEDVEELAFFKIGFLWLALHVPGCIPDNLAVVLSTQVVAEVDGLSKDAPGPYQSKWLLGTTYFDLQHTAWERLGQELADMDLGSREPTAQDWIKLIGSSLAGCD